MFRRIAIALALAGILSAPQLPAQDVADPQSADHVQLRAILGALKDAINSGDYAAIDPYLYTPFSITLVDQKVLTSADMMKAYLDSMVGGSGQFIRKVTMEPVADELTQIYDGRFGVARGGNTEVYEISTGKTITLQTRWTATLIKDQGQWKLLALHNGTDFLDNPILATAGRFAIYAACIGGALGLLLGLLIGWYFRLARRRAPVPA